MVCMVWMVFSLVACTNSSPPTAPDLEGYTLETVAGQSAQLARKTGEEGALLEQGWVENGRKTGTWTVYDPESGMPVKVISFVGGMYNGVYLEFNERGYLTLKAHYRNNQLHGPWSKYRFGGRLEAEARYREGKLDGVYKEYYPRDKGLKEEIGYKMGVQHGPYRYYNENGELTLEYEYANGEKVSGGIIE